MSSRDVVDVIFDAVGAAFLIGLAVLLMVIVWQQLPALMAAL